MKTYKRINERTLIAFEQKTTATSAMAERVRNRIGQEDKERLERAFEAPEQDYLAIADNLGISRSTA
jgi:transcriptional regulator with PAS, ATPase and Fis domain